MDTNTSFPITLQELTDFLSKEQILTATDQILTDFAHDYKKISE